MTTKHSHYFKDITQDIREAIDSLERWDAIQQENIVK